MAIVERFAAISDPHYGYSGNEASVSASVDKLIAEVDGEGLDRFFVCGDLTMNEPAKFSDLKTLLDTVGIEYFIAYGNHERCSDADFLSAWGQNVNHSFASGDYAYIIQKTSDATGRFLAADSAWLATEAAKYSDKKGVFVFFHISPADNLAKYIVVSDSADLVAVPQPQPAAAKATVDSLKTALLNIPNLVCVFHGHHHDINYLYTVDGVQYVGTCRSATSFPVTFDGVTYPGLGYACYGIVEIDSNGTITYKTVKVSDGTTVNASQLWPKSTSTSRSASQEFHSHESGNCCWRKGS